MIKFIIYIFPAMIVPGAFAYFLWEGSRVQGWGGFGYAAVLSSIALISGVAGMVVMAAAYVQRHKGKQDWHWLFISAGVVGIPAVCMIVLLAFN